jgi:delta14-sterol reductase
MDGAGAALAALYVAISVLYAVLPGKVVGGYCCDSAASNKVLRYKLNGFSVFVLVTSVFVNLPATQRLYFHTHFYSALLAANIIGVAVSALFYLLGKDETYARCVTVDQLSNLASLPKTSSLPKKSSLATFYLGRQWNPRIVLLHSVECDIKMLFYCIGAVMLWINILSAMFASLNDVSAGRNHLSIGMIVYVSCFGWFVAEYMLGEQVHLYTYDLFAEKMGFKLSWGCLVFYPFFYSVGVHSVVHASTHGDNDVTGVTGAGIVCLFLIGWLITRGANMQKYYFKTQPDRSRLFFDLIPQQTIPGTKILCSGLWGVARHFNYCGEIIQGLALALPGSLMCFNKMHRSLGISAPSSLLYLYILLPWCYPLYYIALFVTRQVDDEVVCARKYGVKWNEYVKRVPYRICPGLY